MTSESLFRQDPFSLLQTSYTQNKTWKPMRFFYFSTHHRLYLYLDLATNTFQAIQALDGKQKLIPNFISQGCIANLHDPQGLPEQLTVSQITDKIKYFKLYFNAETQSYRSATTTTVYSAMHDLYEFYKMNHHRNLETDDIAKKAREKIQQRVEVLKNAIINGYEHNDISNTKNDFKELNFLRIISNLAPKKIIRHFINIERSLHLELQTLTIQQLVISHNFYKQTQSDHSAIRILKKIANQIITNQIEQKNWSREFLETLTPLAALQDTDTQNNLLSKLIKVLESSSILNPNIIWAIATSIRYAAPIPQNNGNSNDNNNAVTIDAGIRSNLDTILSCLFKEERIFNAMNSIESLKVLLEAINTVLNTMIDQGVPSDTNIDKYRKQLQQACGNKGKEHPEIDYLTKYALQALHWLPAQQSPFRRYLGHSFNIARDALQIGCGIVNMSPNDIVDGLSSLLDSTQSALADASTEVSAKNGWYIRLRWVEPFLKADLASLTKLELCLEKMFSKYSNWINEKFLIGFLRECHTLLLNSENIILRQKIFFILVRLAGIGPAVGEQLKKVVSEDEGKWFAKRSAPFFGLTDTKPSQETILCQKWVSELLRSKKSLFTWTPTQINTNINVGFYIDMDKLIHFTLVTQLLDTTTIKPTSDSTTKVRDLFEWGMKNLGLAKNQNITTAGWSNTRQTKAHLSLTEEKELVSRAYQKIAPNLYASEKIYGKLNKIYTQSNFYNELLYYLEPNIEGQKITSELAETCKHLFNKCSDNNNDLKPVILIYGDQGLGKTSLASFFIAQYWKKFSSYSQNIPIPLFISGRQDNLKLDELALIRGELIKRGCTDNECDFLEENNYHFLAVLDDADERQIKDIYNLSKNIQNKVVFIVTSQLVTLSTELQSLQPNSNIRTHFQMLPFKRAEVKSYLELRSKGVPANKRPPSYEELERHFGNLIFTPFYLKIMVDGWHKVAKGVAENSIHSQDQAELLRIFVHCWYQNSYEKFSKEQVIPIGYAFKQSLQAYGEALAVEMWAQRTMTAHFLPSRFLKPQERKNSLLSFFAGSKDPNIRLCYDGIPLKFTLNPQTNERETAQFVHSLVYEYYLHSAFMSEISALRRESIGLNTKSIFNRRSFIHDASTLEFLKKHLTLDEININLLIRMVQHSKNQPKYAVMAANAISLLVYLRIPLSGQNFSKTHIPDANLSYGLLQQVNFNGATLNGVNLTGAWLKDADLSNTKLEQVQFSEAPYVQYSQVISQICLSPDKNRLVAVSGDTFYVDDQKMSLKPKSQKTVNITSVAFMTNTKLIFGTNIGSFFLVDLEKQDESIIETKRYHSYAVRFIAPYSDTGFISMGRIKIKKIEIAPDSWPQWLFNVGIKTVALPNGYTNPNQLTYDKSLSCLAYTAQDESNKNALIIQKMKLSAGMSELSEPIIFTSDSEITSYQLYTESQVLISTSDRIQLYSLSEKKNRYDLYFISRFTDPPSFTLNPEKKLLYIYGSFLEVWAFSHKKEDMKCLVRYTQNISSISTIIFESNDNALLFNNQNILQTFQFKVGDPAITTSPTLNRVITALTVDNEAPDIIYGLDEDCNLLKWNSQTGENKVLFHGRRDYFKQPTVIDSIPKSLIHDSRKITFYDHCENKIRVYNLKTRRVSNKEVPNPAEYMSSLRNSNTPWIAHKHRNGEISIKERRNNQVLYKGYLGFKVTSIAFHLNGDLYTAGHDGAVKRWHLNHEKKTLNLVFSSQPRLCLENTKIEGAQQLTGEQEKMIAQHRAIGNSAASNLAKAENLPYPKRPSFIHNMSNNNNVETSESDISCNL